MNSFLISRNADCTSQLDYDISYHCNHNVRNEANLLKQAIKLLSKLYGYKYLIAYEYEHHSIYKGDAILAKKNAFGSIDLLAVEAKYFNYISARWRNQKTKLKTLENQVSEYGKRAVHYLKNFDPEVVNHLPQLHSIPCVGVYNDENGRVQVMGFDFACCVDNFTLKQVISLDVECYF